MEDFKPDELNNTIPNAGNSYKRKVNMFQKYINNKKLQNNKNTHKRKLSPKLHNSTKKINTSRQHKTLLNTNITSTTSVVNTKKSNLNLPIIMSQSHKSSQKPISRTLTTSPSPSRLRSQSVSAPRSASAPRPVSRLKLIPVQLLSKSHDSNSSAIRTLHVGKTNLLRKKNVYVDKSESGNNANDEFENEDESESESISGSVSETKSGSVSGSDSGSESESESDMEVDMESVVKGNAESDNENNAESDADRESNSIPKTKTIIDYITLHNENKDKHFKNYCKNIQTYKLVDSVYGLLKINNNTEITYELKKFILYSDYLKKSVFRKDKTKYLLLILMTIIIWSSMTSIKFILPIATSVGTANPLPLKMPFIILTIYILLKNIILAKKKSLYIVNINKYYNISDDNVSFAIPNNNFTENFNKIIKKSLNNFNSLLLTVSDEYKIIKQSKNLNVNTANTANKDVNSLKLLFTKTKKNNTIREYYVSKASATKKVPSNKLKLLFRKIGVLLKFSIDITKYTDLKALLSDNLFSNNTNELLLSDVCDKFNDIIELINNEITTTSDSKNTIITKQKNKIKLNKLLKVIKYYKYAICNYSMLTIDDMTTIIEQPINYINTNNYFTIIMYLYNILLCNIDTFKTNISSYLQFDQTIITNIKQIFTNNNISSLDDIYSYNDRTETHNKLYDIVKTIKLIISNINSNILLKIFFTDLLNIANYKIALQFIYIIVNDNAVEINEDKTIYNTHINIIYKSVQMLLSMYYYIVLNNNIFLVYDLSKEVKKSFAEFNPAVIAKNIHSYLKQKLSFLNASVSDIINYFIILLLNIQCTKLSSTYTDALNINLKNKQLDDYLNLPSNYYNNVFMDNNTTYIDIIKNNKLITIQSGGDNSGSDDTLSTYRERLINDDMVNIRLLKYNIFLIHLKYLIINKYYLSEFGNKQKIRIPILSLDILFDNDIKSLFNDEFLNDIKTTFYPCNLNYIVENNFINDKIIFLNLN